MYVVKRDGRKEPIMFDKITARVRKLCYGLNELVDLIELRQPFLDALLPLPQVKPLGGTEVDPRQVPVADKLRDVG